MLSSSPDQHQPPSRPPPNPPSPPDNNTALPSISKNKDRSTDKLAAPTGNTSPVPPPGPRRPSFNFLRRARSGEQQTDPTSPDDPKSRSTSKTRSISGSRMNKKQKAQLAAAEEARRAAEAAAAAQRPAPRLPSHSPLPQMTKELEAKGYQFGDADNLRPDSVAIISNRAGPGAGGYNNNNYGGGYQGHQSFSRPSVDSRYGGAMGSSPPHGIPVPPIPGSGSRNGEFDPYARTESMTHRGRYSYASSAMTVGTVNSPRRVRRRKDPTPFNVLVIGAKNSGKTSFLNFLRTSLAYKERGNRRQHTPSPPPTAVPGSAFSNATPNRNGTAPFTSYYLETEIDNERIGLTLWDSQGLEKSIVDLQLREMVSFIENKFEETFTEEQKVVRAPGVQDTHIHCVFLVLDPSRLDQNLRAAAEAAAHNGVNGSHGNFSVKNPVRSAGGLDEDFDVQVFKALQGKTTIIPVISKADTLTSAHMLHLKRAVWASLKEAKLDPLEALTIDDDDGDYDSERFDEQDEDEYNSNQRPSTAKKNPKADSVVNNLADRSSSDEDTASESDVPRPSAVKRRSHRRSASMLSISQSGSAEEDDIPYIPLSILSPDPHEQFGPGKAPGRYFPWGYADPLNVEHCDFVRLKDSVFSEWRAELREASREKWYEGWRTSRLKRTGTRQGYAGSTTPSRGTSRMQDSSVYSGGLAPTGLPYRGVSPGRGGDVSPSQIGVAVSPGNAGMAF